MRLTKVRFTTRRMMVITAVPAIFWCMLLGISNLFVYIDAVRLEKHFREGASIWEAKQEAQRALEWRVYANEQARLERSSLARVLTALGLIGLGGIFVAIGLAIRARYRQASTDRPGWLNTFAAVCSGGAKLIFVSLIIAGLTYIGMLMLVLAGDD
jgi:hypothetical protein